MQQEQRHGRGNIKVCLECGKWGGLARVEGPGWSVDVGEAKLRQDPEVGCACENIFLPETEYVCNHFICFEEFSLKESSVILQPEIKYNFFLVLFKYIL